MNTLLWVLQTLLAVVFIGAGLLKLIKSPAELARMLGGMEVTGKAREHAREMLQMAGGPEQKARGAGKRKA